QALPCTQEIVVGSQIPYWLLRRPPATRFLDAPCQCRDDDVGDLVLDGEDIIELPVVSLSPDPAAGGGVDQLRCDTHAVSGPAYAALDDVCHAELASDLLDVAPSFARDPGRRERHHEEIAEPREPGDDVLGNTVGEVHLIRIAAVVVERQ